jgi:hypothetical protein
MGYALLMLVGGKLGWQHLVLPLLFWACLTTAPAARRFVRAWWPLILFWLSYDVMRVFAAALFPRVAVEAPYRWEAALFRSSEGIIWPFHFARWMAQSGSAFWPRALTQFSSLIYLSHVFVMPLIFFVVWGRHAERLFRRLLWSYTALHALTLAIYLVYPAAPPWWVYENGFLRPSLAHSMPMGEAQNSTLSALFRISANRFAAIPSLHAAYPLLLTLVLAWHGSRSRWIVLAGAYAASMWFACVFLNQHYIVDLLIGAALVPLALVIASPSEIGDSHLFSPGISRWMNQRTVGKR